MDKSHDIMDKDGLRSMYEAGWIIDKYAWLMDELLREDKGMDKSHDIIDKDGLRWIKIDV